MIDFNKSIEKFRKEKLEFCDSLVWIHYYNDIPVALMGQFLEYDNLDLKKKVIFEALNQNSVAGGIGFVDNDKDAILPIIFGDNPNFKGFFETSKSDQTLNTEFSNVQDQPSGSFK